MTSSQVQAFVRARKRRPPSTSSSHWPPAVCTSLKRRQPYPLGAVESFMRNVCPTMREISKKKESPSRQRRSTISCVVRSRNASRTSHTEREAGAQPDSVVTEPRDVRRGDQPESTAAEPRGTEPDCARRGAGEARSGTRQRHHGPACRRPAEWCRRAAAQTGRSTSVPTSAWQRLRRHCAVPTRSPEHAECLRRVRSSSRAGCPPRRRCERERVQPCQR